ALVWRPLTRWPPFFPQATLLYTLHFHLGHRRTEGVFYTFFSGRAWKNALPSRTHGVRSSGWQARGQQRKVWTASLANSLRPTRASTVAWLLPLRLGVEVIFAHFHLLYLTLTLHFEDDQLSI